MTERLITHLRHVDLAVPDYATQRDFYLDLWGLTEVAKDGDLSYLAAEGSTEPFVVRLRQSDDKRIDLIGIGAADKASVDQLAAQLGAAGVQLISEPGDLSTFGGGYGFRFFDGDGRTLEVSCDVEERRRPARSSRSSRSRCRSRTWCSTRPIPRAPSPGTCSTSASRSAISSPCRAWAT